MSELTPTTDPNDRGRVGAQGRPYAYVGEPAEASVELVADPEPEFLPLNVRRVLYVIALGALVAAPSIAVELPAYGSAIESAGNLLAIAAVGTALANPTRRL